MPQATVGLILENMVSQAQSQISFPQFPISLSPATNHGISLVNGVKTMLVIGDNTVENKKYLVIKSFRYSDPQ